MKKILILLVVAMTFTAGNVYCEETYLLMRNEKEKFTLGMQFFYYGATLTNFATYSDIIRESPGIWASTVKAMENSASNLSITLKPEPSSVKTAYEAKIALEQYFLSGTNELQKMKNKTSPKRMKYVESCYLLGVSSGTVQCQIFRLSSGRLKITTKQRSEIINLMKNVQKGVKSLNLPAGLKTEYDSIVRRSKVAKSESGYTDLFKRVTSWQLKVLAALYKRIPKESKNSQYSELWVNHSSFF